MNVELMTRPGISTRLKEKRSNVKPCTWYTGKLKNDAMYCKGYGINKCKSFISIFRSRYPTISIIGICSLVMEGNTILIIGGSGQTGPANKGLLHLWSWRRPRIRQRARSTSKVGVTSDGGKVSGSGSEIMVKTIGMHATRMEGAV